MSSCDSCFGTLQMPLAADVLSWLSDSLAEPGEGLSCASSKDMTAVNASHTTNGLHELVSGSGGGSGAGGGGGQTGGGAAALRLPLVAPAAGGGSGGTGAHHAHAVFMYSTAADGNVTLQLRDACGVGDDCSGGGGPGSDDGVTTLSISYQDIATDLLGDAAATIDVLLGAATPSAACTATLHAATGSDVDVSPDGADAASSVLDLFDSSSGGRDLTLSPQTFTSSAEAFISDNSDSLGVPPDAPVCGSDELKKSVGVVTSGDAVKLTVKRARPKVASPNRQGPQQCQVCSKVFGNASALAKHKLTHSDERKYVCSMCGKAFKRQDHLNGHMLTHRNKKPYECKAAGCGKSYCDARSLRRHTENHHSGISSSSSSSSGPGSASGGGGVTTLTPGAASAAAAGGGAGAAVLASGGGAPLVTTSTLSPAQGAASGDAASPHGAASSTCIQYAPAPTGSGSAPASPAQGPRSYETPSTTTSRSTVAGKSQLQQLLASEPAKSSNNTPNNDGLTKQQLELIHQIMEQTQRQSQQITAATNKANAALNGGGSSRTQPVATTNKPKLSRTWSAPAPTTSNATVKSTTSLSSGGNNAGQQSSTSKHPHQNVATAVATPAPKPVECNLCHRKFKNIPALNGHMRLHGGYFKKDADNKKCEKKESSGPPLQTASVSVRALIEEKIISKRTTTTTTSTTTSHPQTSNGGGERQQVVAPPLHPLERTSPKVTSFVVPAPPNHVVVTTASDKQSWLLNDKSRRHSDADKFTMPRNPINTTTVTQQEADVLADLILKRTNTKIVKRTASDPGVTSQQQQLQIQFQEASDSFALAYDGANYFSDDQDTMLLQNIDAAQLAASLLPQDQQLQDIASLEEYASSLQESVDSPSFSHTVNHELQAVLDSPLPESLAEFSTYHPSDSKDVLESFSQRQQRYTDSPTIGRNSSPLMRHDSPGCFAYPTPPASHEGPSSGYGTSHLLPLITDTSSGARDIDEPPQASSPLSAAFYTSTMSSAAAVEEALEEVLPGESIAPDDMYPSLTNSPPPGPQSPLSVSSPGPPISPHYTLQSQMMPNSEDPLLSSSPKEFATRKKFEFQSFKIVSGSGLVELASPTTLIVDSNGELKFIQTGGTKNIVVTSTGVLNGHQTLQVVDTSVNSTSHSVTNLRTDNSGSMSSLTAALGTGLESMRTVGLGTSLGIKSQVHPPQHRALQRIAGGTNIIGRGTTRNVTQPIQRSRLHIAVDNLKSEESDDVFLSPTMIPASPIRVSRKRPRSEPPLAVPVVHQSRLRAARGRPPGAAPYTPAPMLNPSRTGPGLYAHAKWKATSVSQNHLHGHGHVHGHHHIHGRRSPDSTPESDSTPHINVGPQYQCSVPSVPCGMTPLETDQDREPTYEHLLWDPGIGGVCTDTEIEMYLEFACCAAVPGGGRNKEYALHLLHLCAGNIHEAMLRLMQPTPSLPPDHPMLAYQYCESDRWGPQESEAFHRAVLKHGKDFYNVAKEIGTKTVKQCVQFYYVWKKVCSEEYRRIRGSRGARDTPPFADIMEADMKLLGVLDTEPLLTPTPPELPRTFTCEYADCSASFNSRAALNGHIRIHGGTVRRSPTPSNMPGNSSTQISHHHHHLQPQTQDEEFPCKVCGKVFSKIKSRSAHMKSHRPPDAEPRRVSKSSMVSDAPSPGHGYDTSSPIPSLNTAPSPHHGH